MINKKVEKTEKKRVLNSQKIEHRYSFAHNQTTAKGGRKVFADYLPHRVPAPSHIPP